MEQVANLKRQVLDVVSQAERLKRSQNFETDFNSFKQYVEEMKAFMMTHVDNKMVLDRIHRLPILNFNKKNISLLYQLDIKMRLNVIHIHLVMCDRFYNVRIDILNDKITQPFF